MVVAKLKGTAALALFHGQRIILCAVRPYEFIPQAVKSVRLEVAGKILETKLFVKKIMLNDTVLIGRTGTIHAHLEILVVCHDMVEGKFTIGKDA